LLVTSFGLKSSRDSYCGHHRQRRASVYRYVNRVPHKSRPEMLDAGRMVWNHPVLHGSNRSQVLRDFIDSRCKVANAAGFGGNRHPLVVMLALKFEQAETWADTAIRSAPGSIPLSRSGRAEIIKRLWTPITA